MDDGYPDKPGLYKISSMESDYKEDYIAITQEGEDLFVHCLYLGKIDMKTYIDGLTEVKWRFIV